METKFTKGEWKVGDGITSIECENDFIATCHHIAEQWITEEQAIANAKLIAAAPGLLEALLYGHEISSKIQYPTNKELKMFTRMAALAIKKATE